MRKAVMLSVQPKWCELIAIQRKSFEVRKSRPSIETPFKVYIYQTKGKWLFSVLRNAGMVSIAEILEGGFGKVIGEFTCNKVIPVFGISGSRFWLNEALCQAACLSGDEIRRYAGGTAEVYGWHISNLRIYDTPKPLSDFKRWNRAEENVPCAHTPSLYVPCESCKECNLTRAPQSYCFVEELK